MRIGEDMPAERERESQKGSFKNGSTLDILRSHTDPMEKFTVQCDLSHHANASTVNAFFKEGNHLRKVEN